MQHHCAIPEDSRDNNMINYPQGIAVMRQSEQLRKELGARGNTNGSRLPTPAAGLGAALVELH